MMNIHNPLDNQNPPLLFIKKACEATLGDSMSLVLIQAFKERIPRLTQESHQQG